MFETTTQIVTYTNVVLYNHSGSSVPVLELLISRDKNPWFHGWKPLPRWIQKPGHQRHLQLQIVRSIGIKLSECVEILNQSKSSHGAHPIPKVIFFVDCNSLCNLISLQMKLSESAENLRISMPIPALSQP